MTTIALNLQQQRHRVQQACHSAGRDPASVTLLAVSKTFGPEAVAEAVAAGQRCFGENYVQEGVEKVAAFAEHPAALVWHFIGPLQTNKTRLVAEHFDWVQTIDRLKIAQRLSDQRPAHLPPLKVCLQVNVDGGPTKSGVAPNEVAALAQAVCRLPRLTLRGLMCIPEPAANDVAAEAVFMSVKAIFDALNASDLMLDTLSMGMSDDLVPAVTAGATLVRVGRGVFGYRALKT